MSGLAVLAALIELAVKAVASLLLLLVVGRMWWEGPVVFLVDTLRKIPPLRALLTTALRSQAGRIIESDLGIKAGGASPVQIPEKGEDPASLLQQVDSLRTHKTDRMFAYVYSEAAEVLGSALSAAQERAALDFVEQDAAELGGLSPEQRSLVAEYMRAFMHENALNPTLFQALRRFEVELVQMTAGMLHGDSGARGNVTSGGTESILMAVKTYRELAKERRPGIRRPNIVAATTVHPAFNKAAHYFGLEMCLVPVDPASQTASAAALRAAVTPDTVLLVASAPQYCHGVVDPVEQAYAPVAREFGLPLHVDACFGGFMLPWVEKLGYPVPKFDFRVPEVTSVSADLHKYGFAPKGASVIVYRNADLRKHQLYAYSGWPGGLFGSPTMAGTRPGGYLATAWVTLRTLGQEGFLRVAKDLMELTRFWTGQVCETRELKIVGSPQMTCFAITSNNPAVSVFVLADLMEEKGWKMEREANPDCLHFTVLPQHLARRDDFVADIQSCVRKILAENIKPKGMAAVYGMVARVPAKELIDDFLLEFFNQIYS